MKTSDNQIPSNLSKNMFEHSISHTTDNSKIKKIILKTWKIKWDRGNPYLFLEDWRRNDAKMNDFWSETRSVWEKEMGKIVNSHKNSREKLSLKCKTLVFRDWNKSPVSRQGHLPKQFKPKDLKKFAKCFSWLEVSLARESWAKTRKSLCTPRDWTFHLRTSRQKWPARMRLRLATWHTRDWAAKTGQNWIFEIFRFFKQNTFQKHLKHSKIFLCLN